MNTKDNRRIPELHYDWVFRYIYFFLWLLKTFRFFSSIRFHIKWWYFQFSTNAWFTLSAIVLISIIEYLIRPIRKRKLRGVMIGRMAAQNPWLFRHADECFYQINGPHLTRRQIVMNYVDYVESFQKSHRSFISS